jgi:hypothetical protein
MIPAGAAQVIAETWLAERMKTSSHRWERKLWWVPLVAGAALSAEAAIRNEQLH